MTCQGFYIYNVRRREFLHRALKNAGQYSVPVGAYYMIWTAMLKRAQRFANPSMANRRAAAGGRRAGDRQRKRGDMS